MPVWTGGGKRQSQHEAATRTVSESGQGAWIVALEKVMCRLWQLTPRGMREQSRREARGVHPRPSGDLGSLFDAIVKEGQACSVTGQDVVAGRSESRTSSSQLVRNRAKMRPAEVLIHSEA